MSRIKSIVIEVTRSTGKPLTYAISPITVGPDNFAMLAGVTQGMIEADRIRNNMARSEQRLEGPGGNDSHTAWPRANLCEAMSTLEMLQQNVTAQPQSFDVWETDCGFKAALIFQQPNREWLAVKISPDPVQLVKVTTFKGLRKVGTICF